MSIELLSPREKVLIKDDMMKQGLAYQIPSHKLDRLDALGYTPQEMDVRGRRFLGDVITIGGLTSAEHLGLSPEAFNGFSRLVGNVASLAESIRENRTFHSLVNGLAQESSRERMEYSTESHERPLLPDGSLVRLDIVFTGNDEKPLRVCDINLIPQGHALSRAAYESVGERRGLPSHEDIYVASIAKHVTEGSNGIMTSYDAPHWPMQNWVGNRIASRSDRQFGIIAPDDYDQEDSFGVLVRHRRELNGFKAQHLINPPGSRLAETQLLFALASLPGIDRLLPDYPAFADMQELCIPSLMVKKEKNGDLRIAKRIDEYAFIDWAEPDERLKDFVTFGTRLAAVLKSPDTTGSKGVRTISAKRPGELVYNIKKQIDRLEGGTEEPGQAYILQPRYSSTLESFGESKRAKIDLFFTKIGGEWIMAGGDVCTVPIEQQIVHGTGKTEMVVVPELWETLEVNAQKRY